MARRYTERMRVFRKAGCVPRASGQGAPTRRSGPYGEEAQRRPGARGACNAAKTPMRSVYRVGLPHPNRNGNVSVSEYNVRDLGRHQKSHPTRAGNHAILYGYRIGAD
jgi:hypothetical protein